ncbi:hypothetical protein LWI28_027266 [Acer negundo]|uniref:Large ribosomal subunit protein uL3c n=1 Tax=Acer negundo TaxID=4023 RepID=A0AAD5J895_ACENE|nr:hypothetical protein LWI28_027266 [Acer negundo]
MSISTLTPIGHCPTWSSFSPIPSLKCSFLHPTKTSLLFTTKKPLIFTNNTKRTTTHIVSMSIEAGVGVMGTKLGVMSYFEPNGTVVPVTVVGFREGNIVTQIKTDATDGYDAVQVGYRRVRDRKLTKPEMGHLEKSGVIPLRHLQEFRLQSLEGFETGQKLDFEELFKEGDIVDVSGTTIGKGFQGGIKRHNFKRGPMTHGSKSHRALGSIGAGTTPGRVYKGKKMPGRMGGTKRKIRKLKIVKIDNDLRVVMIKGAVPELRRIAFFATCYLRDQEARATYTLLNSEGFSNWMPKRESQRLQHLALNECHDGTLVRAIPNTSSLYSLVISNISNLISFTRWPNLPGLKALYISNCKDLVSLSGEGSLISFSSLELLSIRGCSKLESLPDEGLPAELKCLKSLGKKGTLKSLNSLKDLQIEDCASLLSFPEDGLPTSLQHLHIQDCPSLTQQCGTEWTKISHIPDRETDFIRKKEAHSAAWYLPCVCSGGFDINGTRQAEQQPDAQSSSARPKG